jgi:tRNA-splicing ligase RtcB
MAKNWKQILQRVDELRWDLSRDYKAGMRVPGRIYASEEMLDAMAGDEAIEQVANVAFLPGIVGRSLAMPDIHWGYGFPIGGVAATDVQAGGVISPGGVGYDINCGVRLLRSDLPVQDVRPVGWSRPEILALIPRDHDGVAVRGDATVSRPRRMSRLPGGRSLVPRRPRLRLG